MSNEILGIIIWSFIICLVILILLFLAVRELMCWYWKININNRNLSEINDKLSIIITKMDRDEEAQKKEKKIEDKKIDSNGRYA